MCNGAVKTDVLREHAIDKAILLKVAKSLGLNIARGPCWVTWFERVFEA